MFRKGARGGAGNRLQKSVAKNPAAFIRPVTPPGLPVNPLGGVIKAGANLQRAAQRQARREGVRQVNQPASRPRPVVRPTAPPVKVMPNVPAPNRLQKMAPKAAPPSTPPAVRPRPAGGAGNIATATAIGAMAAAAASGGAQQVASVNTAAATQDLSLEVNALQSSLADLQTRSTFGDVQSDMTELDALVRRVAELLESARQKGYRYQGELEQQVYGALSQWQSMRPKVDANLGQQMRAVQSRVDTLNPQIQRLNSMLANPNLAGAMLRSAQSQVNALLSEASRISLDLQRTYAAVEAQSAGLNNRLNQVHWGLDQLAGARFQLAAGEDLVSAAAARWDKEGKDDPEGVLYLTNKRLVFERKEKVATKKVLFIVTATELVQEVIIDQKLSDIAAQKAESKGLFGHQDFLAVQFKDNRLAWVNFHLNGQDSDDWTTMVERARSGEIENDRAGSGSGLSATDLALPVTQADILSLQSEVNALQDEVMLKEARDELARLENELSSIERHLAQVRAQGYVIEKDLEADLTVLSAQWARVKTNAQATMGHQSRLLGDGMAAAQRELARLVGLSGNLVAARPVYMQVKSAVASLQSQADAAVDTVLAQYDEYGDEVESLSAHLAWVDWMLAALAGASFRLLASESGVAAVEAVYLSPGGEPENGILFLTDQRLLWEDRVGTYELKVEAHLSTVVDVQKEDVASETEGPLQMLNFQFKAPAALHAARFRLSQPVADEWVKMVGRARSGGYAGDRAVQVSEEELERIRNAPQQCSNCGAAFTAPILRGQTEIICEYCGVVARI
jgi:hypothetical protein